MVTCLNLKQVQIKAWRCPTLTWGNPTLPSALFRFTSEFGMESGGSKTNSLIRKAVSVFSTHSILFLLRVHQNPLGVVWLSLTGN